MEREQIIPNIHRPEVQEHFASLGYRTEWHWIQSPETLQYRYATSGTNIWPSGDGPGGGQGIASYTGTREPSRSQGFDIGRLTQGQIGYAYSMRSVEQIKGQESLAAADFTALEGIVEGLNYVPDDRVLSVENGKIYYGDNEITLCGVSRREALWRSTGEYNPMGGWGSDYSLEEYESDIEDSGINYVRHLGIKDTHFMIAHIARMKDIDVIVEIEVYDAYKGNYGILVDIDSMGEVAEIGNVFFDCANEFLNDEDSIDIVIDLAKRLKAQGCIVSAGAWSGEQGYDLSTVFHNRYSDYDIESTHRNWNVETWNEALSYGKPVTWNEYFSQGNLSLQEVKDLMKTAFDMGLNVCYYGFRWPGIPGLSRYDPFPYKSILTYAGELIH